MKAPAFLTALFAFTANSGAQSPALATNALGLDLYRLESASQRGNLLLSPYSIQAALCMALGGANGQTKAEMAKVLHLGGNADAAAKQMAGVGSVLNAAVAESARRAANFREHGGKFEPLQLYVANRLFGSEGYQFHSAFLRQTETQWAAPLEPLMFAKSPDRARQRINKWVEGQTKGRIEDLIPRSGVNETTRLVLVNALYFKAGWEDEFVPALTKPLPFYVNGGAAVNVPTMHQAENFGYQKGAGYTAVTLGYTGNAVQFLIVVPDAPNGLAAVEQKLTAGELVKLAAASRAKEVKLWLPKFKITPPTVPLATRLKSLGMKTAFDEPRGRADFSRMGPRTPADYLMISEVFHKTYIALDEEGTEAAAATAAGIALGAAMRRPEPVEVRVDRPFLFAIQHRETGLCLFLGRVMDPR